jgi:hypothetical protein
MSGYATTQKILREGYFWPSLFTDCITAVQKCHACQIYNQKIRSHPTPLHPVVSVGPFAKWGIDFMTCHPHSVGGHGYIIVAVDYFTKWAEAMSDIRQYWEDCNLIPFQPCHHSFWCSSRYRY